jgi:hypothetical protein
MSEADELNALADRCEREPESRELDLECEKALNGLMARITYPRRYSANEWVSATVQKLRARAALSQTDGAAPETPKVRTPK